MHIHICIYAITQCNVTQNALCHIADWTNRTEPNRTRRTRRISAKCWPRTKELDWVRPGPARNWTWTVAVVIKILYFNLIFLGAHTHTQGGGGGRAGPMQSCNEFELCARHSLSGWEGTAGGGSSRQEGRRGNRWRGRGVKIANSARCLADYCVRFNTRLSVLHVEPPKPWLSLNGSTRQTGKGAPFWPRRLSLSAYSMQWRLFLWAAAATATAACASINSSPFCRWCRFVSLYLCFCGLSLRLCCDTREREGYVIIFNLVFNFNSFSTTCADLFLSLASDEYAAYSIIVRPAFISFHRAVDWARVIIHDLGTAAQLTQRRSPRVHMSTISGQGWWRRKDSHAVQAA